MSENRGRMFLDSGAFSLYVEHVRKRKQNLDVGTDYEYAYYDTSDFWAYVDQYARFVQDHIDVIDYYTTVDVIYNAEKTWEVQQYLEQEHGLRPIPVIHCGADMAWVRHYVERDYTYVGIGGYAAGMGKPTMLGWTTRLFQEICPAPDYLPCVGLHGFAMTNYEMLWRYPWKSVDSATWAKLGAYGNIMVPHKRRGTFVFDEDPYVISVSQSASALKMPGKHYKTLASGERTVVAEWLERIGIPFGETAADGSVIEPGVCNRYAERKIANLLFFEQLRASLPDWPWSFRIKKKGGLGLT